MPKCRTQKSKYLSYILRLSIAGAALYLTFRKENLRDIADVLLKLNLWVFASALGIYVIGQLIFVFRWNLLLRAQSIRISFWPATRLYFLGLFYNNCLPTSVGGDFLRAWYVTHHTDKKVEAALSVFVDRAIGLMGTVIMAAASYWFIPAQGHQGRIRFPYKINFFRQLANNKELVISVLAGLVIVIAALVSSAKSRYFLRGKLAVIRKHWVVGWVKVRGAITIYYGKSPTLLLALFLTFLLQALSIIAVWVIGINIGITANVKYYFIFFPVSWLLGTLPISVGGVGVMELWLKNIFVRVCGVPSELALVLALCQRLIMLFVSLPGIMIHLAGAHLPKDFFVDSGKTIN
jgi:uncharacterized protein (TIRG00374 family)